ncbi:hypothetical protein Tco_0974074 [Tanacetum coccineum]|uniref:Uncharacterized protein n=1 Tax=Tanacetum coccineum TaxID=301880 RepID=A0ABQ5EAJ4_9ASTR
MVAWFLGLEDVLSWLLAIVKHDVITVVRNVIALFKLEMDKQFDELMVVKELLEAYTVGNEKVLHKTVNVVEKGNTVEQLVIIVINSE